jgi:hypothetical protein
MALAALLSTSAAAPLFAQGRMISVSPTTVQQGQPVLVKSPACTGATTVLVDGKDLSCNSEAIGLRAGDDVARRGNP